MNILSYCPPGLEIVKEPGGADEETITKKKGYFLFINEGKKFKLIKESL